MKNLDELLEEVLQSIKENTNSISYNTWFDPIQINSLDSTLHIAYLSVEEDFVKRILNERYLPLLESTFKDVLDEKYKVVINTSSEYKKIAPVTTQNKKPAENKKSKITITDLNSDFDTQKIFNPNYNFDNFVSGDSNKLPYAAALAVAKTPGVKNPLFLHGSSGLGKTHLMHAIGIYILQNHPERNILYVSSEMFTNEFIKSLSDNKTRDFKNKYRNLDVLLIDDIQFLEKKETMQEEFFHTFNALYDLNKQIIISSDRPPNKLSGIEERLRSRFAWNLIADFQPPDYEMRVAVLLKKAEIKNVTITDEIYKSVCYISEHVTDNIRELEGAFNRLVDFSVFLDEPINENLAKRILKDSLKNDIAYIKPEKIKSEVCKHYKIKATDLESSSRKINIAFPRQIAMYLCREMTDLSTSKIGSFFGDRHHSTVMHSHDKIKNDLKTDLELQVIIEEIKSSILY